MLGAHSRSPRSVEITRDENLGAENRAITFGVSSNENIGSFLSNRYQLRLGGQWTELRRGALVGNGVVCSIPAEADACRLLLKAIRWSRYHRAYLFFNRRGLLNRLPAFSGWVGRWFPDKLELRDVTVELPLPRRANQASAGDGGTTRLWRAGHPFPAGPDQQR